MLYNAGIKVLSLTFNAVGSGRSNWFSFERLLRSPWTDLASEPRNFFGITGDCQSNSMPNCRTFMINRSYEGCNADQGWIVLRSASGVCGWESPYPYATVIYSKLSTHLRYSDAGGYLKQHKDLVPRF